MRPHFTDEDTKFPSLTEGTICLNKSDTPQLCLSGTCTCPSGYSSPEPHFWAISHPPKLRGERGGAGNGDTCGCRTGWHCRVRSHGWSLILTLSPQTQCASCLGSFQQPCPTAAPATKELPGKGPAVRSQQVTSWQLTLEGGWGQFPKLSTTGSEDWKLLD